MTYTVDRHGLFCWVVYASFRYQGRGIVSCWTKRGAEVVAEQLNLIERDRAKIEQDEKDYDERMNQATGEIIRGWRLHRAPKCSGEET